MGGDYNDRYKQIKIPNAAFDKHNERRKEAGVTWEEYIDANSGVDVLTQEEIQDAMYEVLKEALPDGAVE